MVPIEISLDEQQCAWIFKPIRSRRDSIILLMRTMKLFLTPVEVPKERIAGSTVLFVGKMSRLIYASDSKIFSISLPFSTRIVDRMIEFSSLAHPSIDNRATSEILALLENPSVFEEGDVYQFVDPIIDASDTDLYIWPLFRELLTWEDGYLRYDYDPAHVNGDIHPLHHVDVFYSARATFKLGLRQSLNATALVDLIDVRTICHYLSRQA